MLIISLAGPSQQFGWVGHGSYAPLNIPNIFKAAGLNTQWIPQVDKIFEAGLSYPAPPVPYAQNKLRIAEPVQNTQPVQFYSSNSHPLQNSVFPPKRPIRNSAYARPAKAPSYITTAPVSSSHPALPPMYEAPAYKPGPSSPSQEATGHPSATLPSTIPPSSASPSITTMITSYSATTSNAYSTTESPSPSPITTSTLPALKTHYSSASPAKISLLTSKPKKIYKPSIPFTAFKTDSYGSQIINLLSTVTTPKPSYKARSTYKPSPSPVYIPSSSEQPSSTYKSTTLPSLTTHKPLTYKPQTHIPELDKFQTYKPEKYIPKLDKSQKYSPKSFEKKLDHSKKYKPTIDKSQFYKPNSAKPVSIKPHIKKQETFQPKPQKPQSFIPHTPITYKPSHAKPTYKSSIAYESSKITTNTPSTVDTTGAPAKSPVFKSQITGAEFYGSTTKPPTPFYASLSTFGTSFSASPSPTVPSFFVSSTPSSYKSTFADSPPQPTFQTDIGYSKPSKPFTAFIGSTDPEADSSDLPKVVNSLNENKETSSFGNSPIVGIIEVEDDKSSDSYQNEFNAHDQVDDGEVFYIFYENEDSPTVRKQDDFFFELFVFH